MNRLYLFLVIMALSGCAAETPAPAPPRPELLTYYYVGRTELNLKENPDPAGKDTALVRFNERLKMLQRRGAWFLVETADGRRGWANEKYLKINPVTDLYVRRWGVRLRNAPTDQARSVERLRLNDLVKLQEQNDQGWAKVTVPRTGGNGWLEISDLTLERVVVRRPVRRATSPAESEAGSEPAPAPAQVEPPPPPAPAQAEAAPPPPKPEKPSPRRKVNPEMFEPF